MLALSFCCIIIWLSVVLNLCSASVLRAILSSRASFERLIASVSKSAFCDKDRKPRTSLWSSNHKALSNCCASCPEFCKAFTNSTKTCSGCSLYSFLNSSLVIQTILAYFSNWSPPIVTALFISSNTFCTAVPHASASIPTDEKAVAIAIIFCWFIPAICPAPAIL